MARTKWMGRMLLVAGVMVLAVGCAKPPTAELDTAQSALNQASDLGAAAYAPEAWAQAQEAMTAAQAEMDLQNGKFVLVRSYSKAKELIAKAEQEAQTAQDEGRSGKARAKAEAEGLLVEVNSGVAAARALLDELAACKRKPKGFASDLEQLEGSLQGLEQLVPGIADAITNEDYRDASAQAGSLQEQINTLVTDLESAKAKMRC